MSVNFCVLGSGSKGNCTAIWTDNTLLLVDAGRLAVRYINSSLAEAGFRPSDIDAVIITHCHTDHFNDTTYRLCGPENIPVYCSVPTWHGAMKRKSNRRLVELKKHKLLRELPKEEFKIGNFIVKPFRVSHSHRASAGEPVGFTIRSNNKKISYTTDLGHVTSQIEEELKETDAIIIESNHDVEMEINSGRHPDTIKWVLSNTGHLSNEQCSKALVNVMRKSRRSPRHIVLAHLSEDCNSPELALTTTGEKLDKLNLKDINIIAASQKTPTPIISID